MVLHGDVLAAQVFQRLDVAVGGGDEHRVVLGAHDGGDRLDALDTLSHQHVFGGTGQHDVDLLEAQGVDGGGAVAYREEFDLDAQARFNFVDELLEGTLQLFSAFDAGIGEAQGGGAGVGRLGLRLSGGGQGDGSGKGE